MESKLYCIRPGQLRNNERGWKCICASLTIQMIGKQWTLEEIGRRRYTMGMLFKYIFNVQPINMKIKCIKSKFNLNYYFQDLNYEYERKFLNLIINANSLDKLKMRNYLTQLQNLCYRYYYEIEIKFM